MVHIGVIYNIRGDKLVLFFCAKFQRQFHMRENCHRMTSCLKFLDFSLTIHLRFGKILIISLPKMSKNYENFSKTKLFIKAGNEMNEMEPFPDSSLASSSFSRP